MPLVRSLPVLLITVALGACGSSSSGDQAKTKPAAPKATTPAAAPAPQKGGTTTLQIKDFEYHPKTTTVKVGTRITWTDKDSTNHTVTADDNSFDVGNISAGASGSHTFAKAGTFAYHCTYHPNMHGRVIVR